MFFWKVSAFLNELDAANPPLAEIAHRLIAAVAAGRNDAAVELFATIKDESIDYALMEKARNVRVAPAGFAWDDIGSWDALDRTLPAEANGNVAVGDPILVDARNCIVYNDPGAERRAVAVVGLENVVVVVADDAVLVIPKDRAQEVRKVVAELKRRRAAQL